MHLATALEVAGVQNPELLLARERVTEAMADKQLAAALEADEAYHGQIVG